MITKILMIISVLSSVCFSSQNHKKTNKIDSLQNVEDIQKFIGEKSTEYITVSEQLQYNDQCRSTYDNLKTKKISDYGMMGTRGLKKLYNVLFDLRGSIEWKK